jgi:predicted GNAT family acetyltransferase
MTMAHTFALPNSPPARYELDVDGHIAFANYRNIDGVIAITHTEVPSALRERGVGSRLVLEMLGDIRAQNLKVRPLCSFARFVVAQHPEFGDLVA